MESLTRFLEGRMRLKVNRTKSAVDRPWKRTFLGYTVTTHFSPRVKPAPASLTRAKDRIRHITHAGRGRNIRTVIDAVNRFTRGWVGYCRLATVTDPFDKLDQWIRRRLRKILWEQWKKPQTRCRKMVALGLEAARARKATATGRGAWWNAGASHMHAAVNNRLLAVWGLLNLPMAIRPWSSTMRATRPSCPPSGCNTDSRSAFATSKTCWPSGASSSPTRRSGNGAGRSGPTTFGRCGVAAGGWVIRGISTNSSSRSTAASSISGARWTRTATSSTSWCNRAEVSHQPTRQRER